MMDDSGGHPTFGSPPVAEIHPANLIFLKLNQNTGLVELGDIYTNRPSEEVCKVDFYKSTWSAPESLGSEKWNMYKVGESKDKSSPELEVVGVYDGRDRKHQILLMNELLRLIQIR